MVEKKGLVWMGWSKFRTKLVNGWGTAATRDKGNSFSHGFSILNVKMDKMQSTY